MGTALRGKVPRSMKQIAYSVIIPVKNEARSLPQLLCELNESMRNKKFEVIAVNDGSADRTKQVLRRMEKRYPFLTSLNFPVCAGKWNALAAGFLKSRGAFIITLDGDLQDDPHELPRLLSCLHRGYDVVSGWRRNRCDLLYKAWISNFGNWCVSLLTKKTYRDMNSPFKIYRRSVYTHIPKAGSLLRFSLLFAEKLGYRTIEVPIHHRPRLFGRSKFGMVKYIRILYDLILVLLLFTGSGKLTGPVIQNTAVSKAGKT
jgi:glycosyltransferase involved in cell wall biosynthesis